MAKQIIVLQQNSNGTDVNIQAVMWYPITSGAQQQNGSQWSGASAAEIAAIQSGAVLEEVRNFAFPVGTPAAAIKAVLQQAWTDRNAHIAGIGPNVYYGIYYDPTATGWSA